MLQFQRVNVGAGRVVLTVAFGLVALRSVGLQAADIGCLTRLVLFPGQNHQITAPRATDGLYQP